MFKWIPRVKISEFLCIARTCNANSFRATLDALIQDGRYPPSWILAVIFDLYPIKYKKTPLELHKHTNRTLEYIEKAHIYKLLALKFDTIHLRNNWLK